jgi:hypothetical protein
VLKSKHLKLKVARGNGASSEPNLTGRRWDTAIDALGWGMANRLEAAPIQPGQLLDLAFTIERNNHEEFGGQLELCICDYVLRGDSE